MKAGKKENGSTLGMEQVRSFDKMYLEMEKENILLKKTISYFMEAVATMVIFIICSGEIEPSLLGMIFFYILSLQFQVDIYMNIQEEGRESIRIYDLLAQAPVHPMDIFRVRIEYIKNMLGKRLLLLYGLQLPYIA